MALLVSPPSYLSAADFSVMPNDYDFSGYTDSQLQGMLNRASAWANSIMRRNLLATEDTIRYYGNDSNRLDLYQRPLLYVKRVQVVVPGTTGISLPLEQLLIDYRDGEMLEYTPLLWMGAGLTTIFPHNVPVEITLAYGYGANVVKAPTWTSTDGNGSLTTGQYNVAVTARTMFGEVPATARVVDTASGAIVITVNPVLGAYVYRAYISDATHNTTLSADTASGATTLSTTSTSGITAGSSWLVDSEIVTIASVGTNSVTLSQATASAHSSGASFIPVPTAVAEAPFTSFGSTPIGITIASLTPAAGLWPDNLPVVDTSAPPIPQEIIEAVRLLTLSMVYEQNNLANRGVYMTDDGKKRVSWVSTEGRSGKGIPTLVQQADVLLDPFKLNAIY